MVQVLGFCSNVQDRKRGSLQKVVDLSAGLPIVFEGKELCDAELVKGCWRHTECQLQLSRLYFGGVYEDETCFTSGFKEKSLPE